MRRTLLFRAVVTLLLLAVAPAGVDEADGLYFLAAGRTLTLAKGHFTLMTRSAPDARVELEGTVTREHGVLLLRSAEATCRAVVRGGRLWLGVLGREGTGRWTSGRCDARLLARPQVETTWNEATGHWTFEATTGRVSAPRTFREGKRVVADAPPGTRLPSDLPRDFTLDGDALRAPWSTEVGPVGLSPAPGLDASGTWVGDRGERVVVDRDAPAPAPVLLSGTADLSRLPWRPGADGVSQLAIPLNHGMNHVDTPVQVFWVLRDADHAVRAVSGGCNDLGVRLESFHRLK